eukprot:405323-Rhodomonas_salina.1
MTPSGAWKPHVRVQHQHHAARAVRDIAAPTWTGVAWRTFPTWTRLTVTRLLTRLATPYAACPGSPMHYVSLVLAWHVTANRAQLRPADCECRSDLLRRKQMLVTCALWIAAK